MSAQRWTVAAVVAGHFAAAFAALGMPPFFPLILRDSLHSDAAYLAGWCYVLPTLLMALSAPWWGALADRFGTKTLLIRAQLGLSASFLLAGFADSVPVFLAALALQGLLGGTFAATNAYLATLLRGNGLTRTLTLTQGSARAALVVAPTALGAFMAVGSPIELYRWLALLPLAAALVTWRLPTPGTAATARRAGGAEPASPALRRLAGLQFAFAFATVVTFPYFVPYTQERLPGLSPALAGLLFGLPHVVYLAGAAPLSLWLGQRRLLATLGGAFALLAASLAAQAAAADLPALALGRVAMGLAMTAGFIALHGMIAAATAAGTAGRTFGWLDSAAKWGGVAAGGAAGIVVPMFGSGAPFLLGALVLALTAGCVLAGAARRSRLQPS